MPNLSFPPSLLSPYFTSRRGTRLLGVNDIQQILDENADRVALFVNTFSAGSFFFSTRSDDPSANAMLYVDSNIARWCDRVMYYEIGPIIGSAWYVENSGGAANVGWTEIIYRPPQPRSA